MQARCNSMNKIIMHIYSLASSTKQQTHNRWTVLWNDHELKTITTASNRKVMHVQPARCARLSTSGAQTAPVWEQQQRTESSIQLLRQ